MNQKYEKSQISDWVAAYRESGSSIYEFCKDKPFHASDLFHWLEVNGSKVDVLQRAIVDEPGNFIEVDGPWPTAASYAYDLNEDFMKHQLDNEFKEIITEFGYLLRKIITTIDKYGLKQFHLNKHKKEVDQFYNKTILQNFESELAISYQKRFVKYKGKLFLFLNHDGIPWNNNNAEHSIKPFAKWRKKISKSLTKKNIEHHLILLSILQTCKYQEVNFFEFLKSGKKSIYNLSDS